MRFTVRAPASSANLGPGFDALALAVDLWNAITIDTSESPGVRLTGADAGMLEGKENYSLLAMKEVATLYGKQLPPFSLTALVDVPVARGLGSSAAALVCGLIAANELLDLGLTRTDIYQQAWQMEGHGDNVGAAVYGGAVLSVNGMQDVIQLSQGPELGLKAVVFIPEATSATWAARAALPTTVPLPDAAHNVSLASGLSVGLMTRNRDAIVAGMHDRLHEPYRARLFPHLTPMTDAARQAGAWGACLSGAGPTILTLAEPEAVQRVSQALSGIAESYQVTGRVEELDPASRGAHLVCE